MVFEYVNSFYINQENTVFHTSIVDACELKCILFSGISGIKILFLPKPIVFMQ